MFVEVKRQGPAGNAHVVGSVPALACLATAVLTAGLAVGAPPGGQGPARLAARAVLALAVLTSAGRRP